MSAKGDCVMVCEYCGRQFAQLPENGVCPGCGASAREKATPVFPEPPIGAYKNLLGDVAEITSDALVFRMCFGFWQYKTQIIPYTDIYNVQYEPGNWFFGGWLCVHTWEEKYKPLPKTMLGCLKEKIQFYIRWREKNKFSGMIDYLQQCAEIANAAREEK